MQLERATAMKLGLLQPRACWVKFKVARSAHNGKGGMRQGKSGIAGDRIGQMLGGFFQQRWITSGTESETPHEFRICHRFRAIAWAALDRHRTQRPLQYH